MFWIWKYYKRNNFKCYFICNCFLICFSIWGSVFNRDMQSGLSMPNCSEMLFLFHEGMLTNIEHSAVLLYEETFGQTERSPEQYSHASNCSFLFQPSQKESRSRPGGWRPATETSRIYLGKVTSITAPAEPGQEHAHCGHARKHLAFFPAQRTDMSHCQRGWH